MELPEDIQKRVMGGFRHCPGEGLDPDERRARAEILDTLHDPAVKKEQERLWELERVKGIWEMRNPDERRARAKMWDGLHDPVVIEAEKQLWELAGIERIAKIEDKIEEREAIPCETQLDLDSKEKKLKKLNKKLRKAKEQYDRVLGNGTPVSQKTKRDKKLQAKDNNSLPKWVELPGQRSMPN